MKKYVLFIFIFLLFICGCNNESNNTDESKINCENEISLIKEYDEVTNKYFNIRDYVLNQEFSVLYENETYSTNNSMLFVLHDGLNSFKIKNSIDEKNLDIYLLKNVTVNILNYNGTVKKSLTYLENTIILEEDIKEYRPVEEYKEWLQFDVSFPLKLTGDINISSLYKKSTFNVTFVYNDFKETKEVEAYSMLEFPNLDKNMYNVSGWYCNNVKYNNGDIFIPENGLTFTASVSKKQYSITYLYNGLKKEVNVCYLDNINDFIPEVSGYKFKYWMYNDLVFDETVFKYSESITLEAVFEKEIYSIKYYDESTLLKEVPISYLDKIDDYIPEKDGFKFVCWMNENVEFLDKTFNLYSNLILVAKWKEKITSINLNLISLIGECNSTCEILDNGLVLLPTINVSGYAFKGWYLDTSFTNKVNNIVAEDYNDQPLYALLEPIDSSYVGFIPFTWFNKQENPYDQGCLYDSSHNPSATLYWYKIGLTKKNNNYYVSGVAKSGTALSTITPYDYIFLAYSAYPLIDTITSLGISSSYYIDFVIEPENLSNGDVFNIMYVYDNTYIKENLELDYTSVIEYLDSIYYETNEVNSNINLINSYSGYNIEWFSNSRMTISDEGIYNLPAVDRNVTLTAYIDDTEIYSFSVFVKGVKEESSAISVGYIYTPFTITDVGMSCVDLIICSFLYIDEYGNFTNESTLTNKMNTYIFDKAKKAGTKVSVSINQNNSGNFDKVIEDDSLLNSFADKVLEFVEKNNLDGIDIDWETPSSSKKTNFTKLMKTLYEKLKAYDSSLIITAAIAGGKWQPPRYDLDNSKNYMDYINMMTYSMVNNSGCFSAPLYKSNSGKTLDSCSIEESIEIYHSFGISNSQILVGIPFYGTKQTGTLGPGSGKGSGSSVWLDSAFESYPLTTTMKEYFDRECCQTYRFDETAQVMITYEDERSIAMKCDYINSLGLAGIMYWQYGQDINDNYSLLINKYIRK